MDADFRLPSIYVPSTCTPGTRAEPQPGGPVRRAAQLRKEFMFQGAYRRLRRL